jgi:hypothetical protein
MPCPKWCIIQLNREEEKMLDRVRGNDIITATEFDTVMQTGLERAKSDDSISVDEAFNQLKTEI